MGGVHLCEVSLMGGVPYGRGPFMRGIPLWEVSTLT